MAEEPDRLRQDIEDRRAALTRDVDALADKTSPKRVAQRRWTAAKDRVMGSADHARHRASSAGGTVQDTATAVKDRAGEAPHLAAEQTRGNPLAAGLIAFGAGLLAATLIPVTDAERRAGQQLKDNAGPLTDRVKDVAGEMKDDLSGTVRQAADEVKATAQDAAGTTKEQTRSSAQQATQQTREAAREA